MPTSWIVVAVAAVLGFFVGSVNPATIIATVLHMDLHQGSGNPGATNAGRVLGLKWGVIVGVLDVLKGLVPTLLALLVVDRFTAYVVGLAAVLGHREITCPRTAARPTTYAVKRSTTSSASSVGTSPLRTSSTPTMTPHFRPRTRPALVAPGLPEPWCRSM